MIIKLNQYLTMMFVLFVSNHFSMAENIENTKTEDHYIIPGTKYAIIPPEENFINSSDYTGLQNKEYNTGINITQIPMHFDSVLAMFTKDIPPKNGKLLLENDFIINGLRSKLFKTNTTNSILTDSFENTPNSEKTITWVLISGNSDFSFVLTSAYIYTLDEALATKIKKSMLSFVYLENEEANPLEQLSFTVDISKSDLKFATILMQTGVAYTIDGKFPTETEDKTVYMIMVMPFGTEKNDRKQRAIRNVKKPTDNLKIEQTNDVDIDGLSGYEIFGYEEKGNNQIVLKYGTTLFDENRQYRIAGTTNHNLENNLNLFKKLTRSFKLKK
jgi:hypothetical protein